MDELHAEEGFEPVEFPEISFIHLLARTYYYFGK